MDLASFTKSSKSSLWTFSDCVTTSLSRVDLRFKLPSPSMMKPARSLSLSIEAVGVLCNRLGRFELNHEEVAVLARQEDIATCAVVEHDRGAACHGRPRVREFDGDSPLEGRQLSPSKPKEPRR